MGENDSYTVTVLLDVNETQDVDDRAEARSYLVADRDSAQAVLIDMSSRTLNGISEPSGSGFDHRCLHDVEWMWMARSRSWHGYRILKR